MTTRTLHTEWDRRQAIARLQEARLPCTLTLTKGVKRSLDQNRLQRLWLREAEEQGDQTAEEYRGYCKLTMGVPILRAEHEDFCEVYDRLIRPRSYEEKLELMMIPMDLPITRLMSTSQHARYLDAMYQHFTGLGFRLTDPDYLRWEQTA